ncbi:MAG TPA: hypothetical protein VGU71_04280 [Candidatus Dormibacteraeota bacterium]|nr:hypothetical protein [Candidatus Dormibacteraeota bacterium]
MSLMPATTRDQFQRPADTPRDATSKVVVTAGAAGIAVLIGVAVAGGLPVSRTVVLALLGAALLLLVASSTLLRSWQLALGAFLVWLVVEDLVRKLSGNDIRIYFVKDVIYLLLLISLFTNPATRGAWRAATGNARLPLYALMCWAVIMAIPLAVIDWKLPVVGYRLDFLYFPLVVAGFLLAHDARILSRALLLISLLGAAASAVGILQAILGPGFLSPGLPTPGLINLVLIRAGGTVYRPTGTFVDPGRFDSMAVIAVVVGLAAVLVNRGRLRAVAGVGLLVSLAAVWVSGGRSGLLQALALVGVALVPLMLHQRKSTLATVGLLSLGAIAGVAAIAYVFPNLLSNRLAFYWETLNPLSGANEWAYRWIAYTADIGRGISLGGLVGLGTGHESLGKQYLYGGASYSTSGQYLIEGGYAAVAVEFGLVGLALWLVWTLSWARRQVRLAWAERKQPLGSAGLVLVVWIVIFLFIQFVLGFQAYQNYLANAYFWLLSGVVFGIHPALQFGGAVHK